MIKTAKEKFSIANELISSCPPPKTCGNRIPRITEINRGIMVLNSFLSQFCLAYKF